MLVKRRVALLGELLVEYGTVWDVGLVRSEKYLPEIMTRVPKTWMVRCGCDEKELDELVKRSHAMHHCGIDTTLHFANNHWTKIFDMAETEMRRKIDRETDPILRTKYLTIQKNVVNNRRMDKPSEVLKYFHKRFSEILGGERPNFQKKRRPSKVEVFTMANIIVTAANTKFSVDIDGVPLHVKEIGGRENERMDQSKEIIKNQPTIRSKRKRKKPGRHDGFVCDEDITLCSAHNLTLNDCLMCGVFSTGFPSHKRLQELKDLFAKYLEAGAEESYSKIAIETVKNNMQFIRL
ncbi:ENPEP [Lepeophtheirus salmonis]|uniref:ENPEP n=1 Tax=Lepeophtheirus salmonis TaxID=72036 RepID=A0A7R8CGI7_LEPSM|nr:ENPEP [Lepeophtheirus salmonis]CAF2769784.1 ENPEP [Lepeophtheirus salmonis]